MHLRYDSQISALDQGGHLGAVQNASKKTGFESGPRRSNKSVVHPAGLEPATF